ncbi:MAG: glycerate kinase [Ornithinimicrobium sp.]
MRVVIIAEHAAGAPERGTSQSQRGLEVAHGWKRAAPHDEVETHLVSTGGAGFTDALAPISDGTAPVVIEGPGGAQMPAQLVRSGTTCYADTAEVVGTHLGGIGEQDRVGQPQVGKDSAAVGELLLAARATGAERIVVGVADDVSCHDGGEGLLRALGAGPDCVDLPQVIQQWSGLSLVLATASMVPLTGFGGASASLQSDRGLDPTTAQEYEAQIGSFVDSVDAALRASRSSQTDLLTGSSVRRERTPGAGAGGGIGYALQLLGASTVPGATFMLEEVGVNRRLPGALVVLVTQCYDWRSVSSGVVAEAASAALAVAAPTVLLADEVMVGRREGMSLGISSTYARRPGESATELGARVARTWSPPPRP